jgi:hypothetical protein
MDRADIERILSDAEAALSNGGPVDLKPLGFWRAVEAVKQDRDWVEIYADRISAIDRAAFRRRAWIDVPLNLGLAGLATGTLAGAALVGSAFRTSSPANGLLTLAGAGALLLATHDLAHWIAGLAVGIRFTDLYVARPSRPQPGLKIDYATYLRTPPRARAWMHASGALVTKVIPFALIPIAVAARTPLWVPGVLGVLGVAQIVTDVVFSTRTSDWKRFGREMGHARAGRATRGAEGSRGSGEAAPEAGR